MPSRGSTPSPQRPNAHFRSSTAVNRGHNHVKTPREERNFAAGAVRGGVWRWRWSGGGRSDGGWSWRKWRRRGAWERKRRSVQGREGFVRTFVRTKWAFKGGSQDLHGQPHPSKPPVNPLPFGPSPSRDEGWTMGPFPEVVPDPTRGLMRRSCNEPPRSKAQNLSCDCSFGTNRSGGGADQKRARQQHEEFPRRADEDRILIPFH